MKNINQKEIGYLINIGFMVLISMASLLFMTTGYSQYITKTTASLLFVICGATNLILCIKTKNTCNIKVMTLMLLGLFFAMLGDILLIDYFIIGALLFAVGHVFYFVAYCFVERLKLKDLIWFAIIFVPSLLLILLFPKFEFNGMQLLIIFYALIISAMLGKAVSNLTEKNNFLIKLVMATGALFFFLSDLMLLFNNFANMPKIYDIICIALYYPAEFILAFSIFLTGFNFKTTKEIKQVRKNYNKLVRDKIPEIIKENNGTPFTTVLNDKEYLQELNTKMQEELREYLGSGEVEELCDLEEVLRAILAVKNVTYQQFEEIRNKKVQKRGAFEKRLFLQYVDEE